MFMSGIKSSIIFNNLILCYNCEKVRDGVIMKDYYELLEVHPNASQEIIKKAYATLAKKYHPDTTKFDKDFAKNKMAEINEAYEILSNAQKRSDYDNIYKNSKTHQPQNNTVNEQTEKKPRVNIPPKKNILIIVFIITILIIGYLTTSLSPKIKYAPATNEYLKDPIVISFLPYNPGKALDYIKDFYGELTPDQKIKFNDLVKTLKEKNLNDINNQPIQIPSNKPSIYAVAGNTNKMTSSIRPLQKELSDPNFFDIEKEYTIFGRTLENNKKLYNSKGAMYEVITNDLHLRRTPSVSGEILETLNKGDMLKPDTSKDLFNVNFDNYNWCRVILENGKLGWVSTKYLKLKC